MALVRKKQKVKKKEVKKKVNVFAFLIKRRITRAIKFLIYSSPIILVVLIASLIYFKKEYTDESIKKIKFIYTKNIDKSICNNVNIDSVLYADKDKINKEIQLFCDSISDKTFLYSINDLKNKILEDPWIKKLYIQKQLPYTLNIIIEEYKPFAIFKEGKKFKLIDQYGNEIKISDKERSAFFNLLIIAGENSKKYVQSLFNLLSINPEIFSRIKIANRIGNRRWNIVLDNNVLIILPEDGKGLIQAWRKLEETLAIDGIEIGLESIDLRVPDRMFLKYDEETFRDINKNTR